jgi:hypothetical protein
VQLRHKRQQLPPAELALHDRPALSVHPVNLKQILGQIYSQCLDIHLSTSLAASLRCFTTILADAKAGLKSEAGSIPSDYFSKSPIKHRKASL